MRPGQGGKRKPPLTRRKSWLATFHGMAVTLFVDEVGQLQKGEHPTARAGKESRAAWRPQNLRNTKDQENERRYG